MWYIWHSACAQIHDDFLFSSKCKRKKSFSIWWKISIWSYIHFLQHIFNIFETGCSLFNLKFISFQKLYQKNVMANKRKIRSELARNFSCDITLISCASLNFKSHSSKGIFLLWHESCSSPNVNFQWHLMICRTNQ